MGYKKYDIPVAFGRLVNEGNDFLGIQVTNSKGDYVLYNLEDRMVTQYFGQSTVDYEEALEVQDLQLPQGVSNNGAYFFTDYVYKFHGNECEIAGCSVEVFDRETGTHVAHIAISQLYDDWEDDCLIAEAAKLDGDKYFFVYYDNEEDGWDSLESCIYDAQTEKINIIGGMGAEDGFFVDMRFDVEDMMLKMRCVDSEALHLRGRDVWQMLTYQLTPDYRNLRGIGNKDAEFLVPFIDEDLGKNLWQRVYEAGFTVKTAKKGLFGKEEVAFIDNQSGKTLCSVEVTKNVSYWFEFLEAKGVLVVGVNDHKAEMQKLAIFEKGIGGYELAEEMNVPYEAIEAFDEDNQAILLKTEQNTFVIK